MFSPSCLARAVSLADVGGFVRAFAGILVYPLFLVFRWVSLIPATEDIFQLRSGREGSSDACLR